MSGAHGLHWFSFTTIGRSPEPPVAAISDCVTRFPEVGCDSRIRTVLQQAEALAAFDLVSDLGAELEIQAHVLDTPRSLRFHENTAVGIRDHIVPVPCARVNRPDRHT